MALPYDTDALIKQTQQMLAQTKAEGSKAFAGSAYDTVKAVPLPNTVNTGAINVANLATPATPLNPTEAQPPVYTTPAIPQALVQTDANKSALSGADASLGRIAEYRAQLAGQSSFTEQQKEQQDIIGKQAVVTQYTNQLNQAKQEAQGIQLQLQTTLQQQQEAARGQGVTAGGLAPHLRASQTTANQALLSNAIKQYGIGASLAAAQGDLTSALDYIDQAVKLQFDPITANLQAELANLDAIKNSSAYTEAEKKRAMALEYQVQQEIAENEEKKEERRAILDMAAKAASQGADGLTLQAISSAQSQEEVLAIMQQAGLFTPEPSKRDTQVVQLKDGRTVLLDTQTGEVIKSFVGGIAPSASGGATIVTKTGETVEISKEAKNWVDLINNGAISFDEALTKIGSTAASMELKNEIIAGINAQGGQTETKIQQMQNTVSTIDDILGGDFEYFGASIAPRDGFLGKIIGGNPYYESFKSKVDNLVASLTADNLSLLKGPMSDKDIEFIKALSSGITLKMSETEAKKRLEQIKQRLNEKIEKTSGTNTGNAQLDSLRAKYNY